MFRTNEPEYGSPKESDEVEPNQNMNYMLWIIIIIIQK